MIFAGDTHGFKRAFEIIDAAADSPVVIQVGDFGVLFHEVCPVERWFNARTSGPVWITCGGNHDNWPLWRTKPEVELFGGKVRQLAPNCYFADRNTLLTIGDDKILFFGGAESTDRYRRTEGLDWWSEETPTYKEFFNFVDILESEKPNIVITHDAPLSVPIFRTGRDENPTPRNLENAFRLSEHKPARWYFGHHHTNESWKIGETTFTCCGLNGDYVSD
jgi:hypothetical protein